MQHINSKNLLTVADRCAALTYEGAMDFRDGSDKPVEYRWDGNGNMTRDRNKGIYSISYNVLNLPREIVFGDGHVIRHTYAADGRRLRSEYVLSNIAVVWDDDIPEEPLDPMVGALRAMGRGGDSPQNSTDTSRDHADEARLLR